MQLGICLCCAAWGRAAVAFSGSIWACSLVLTTSNGVTVVVTRRDEILPTVPHPVKGILVPNRAVMVPPAEAAIICCISPRSIVI